MGPEPFSKLLLSRILVRGTLTDVHIESIRTEVEASNSMPSCTHGPRRPQPQRWKERPANRPGLERRLQSNTETGSYESEGLERKDAARRLTWAREPGHLMRLPRSHLTRQSREA